MSNKCPICGQENNRDISDLDIDNAARKAFEAAQGIDAWDTVGEYTKEIYRKMVRAIFY